MNKFIEFHGQMINIDHIQAIENEGYNCVKGKWTNVYLCNTQCPVMRVYRDWREVRELIHQANKKGD